jgi:outer membrane biosynthesis protein TonB
MPDSEKLLTMEERDACQKVAASNDTLASQRATALLAIDEGATRAQTVEQTGLTVGQIGYLLRAFRQKRLALFPAVEPDEAQPPVEAAAPEAEASKPKADKRKKKAKKTKKEKKDKKAKAKEKAKKPKKNEKGKKDKAAKKKSKKK